MRKWANKPHYPVSKAIISTEKNTPSCSHPNRPYWWQPESLQAAGARRSQHPPLPPPLLSMLHDEVGSGLSLWFLLCLEFCFCFLTISVYQQSWISLTRNFTEEPSETCTQISLLCSHTWILSGNWTPKHLDLWFRQTSIFFQELILIVQAFDLQYWSTYTKGTSFLQSSLLLGLWHLSSA